VAVRALVDRAPPQLAAAVDRQHVVDHAGAQQHAARGDRLARRQRHAERAAAARDRRHADVAHVDVRVARELLAPGAAKLVRRRAVAGDEVVDVLGGGVAARPGVAQQDALAGARERQRGGQPAGATADDHDVELRSVTHVTNHVS
jgi:hypothetical protein